MTFLKEKQPIFNVNMREKQIAFLDAVSKTERVTLGSKYEFVLRGKVVDQCQSADACIALLFTKYIKRNVYIRRL